MPAKHKSRLHSSCLRPNIAIKPANARSPKRRVAAGATQVKVTKSGQIMSLAVAKALGRYATGRRWLALISATAD
jgi:hypothetical protein